VGSPFVRWFEAFPSRKFGTRFDLRGVSRGQCHRINVAHIFRPGRQLRSLVHRPNWSSEIRRCFQTRSGSTLVVNFCSFFSLLSFPIALDGSKQSVTYLASHLPLTSCIFGRRTKGSSVIRPTADDDYGYHKPQMLQPSVIAFILRQYFTV
jgi:hypothetical protein